jgi:hypothetical protein
MPKLDRIADVASDCLVARRVTRKIVAIKRIIVSKRRSTTIPDVAWGTEVEVTQPVVKIRDTAVGIGVTMLLTHLTQVKM